jgi:CRP-like cAMP-binding protein
MSSQQQRRDDNNASHDDDDDDDRSSSRSPPVTPFSSSDMGSTGGASPSDPEMGQLVPDRWPTTAAEEELTPAAEVGQLIPDRSPAAAEQELTPAANSGTSTADDTSEQPPGRNPEPRCNPLPEWMDDDDAILDEAELISSRQTDLEATEKAIAAAAQETKHRAKKLWSGAAKATRTAAEVQTQANIEQYEVTGEVANDDRTATADVGLEFQPEPEPERESGDQDDHSKRVQKNWNVAASVVRQERTKAMVRKVFIVSAEDARERGRLYGAESGASPHQPAVQAIDPHVDSLNGNCTIDPHGSARQWWDVAQLLLLGYVGIVVPYRVALETEPETWSFLFGLDFCVDLYFVIDIILNFRTKVELKRSGDTDDTYIEDDPGKIAVHYTHCCGPPCPSSCRKGHGDCVVRPPGWFWIDFVSCFPFHYISGNGDTKVVKLLRLLRFLKLLRMLRIKRLLKRLENTDLWHKLASGYKTIGILFLMIYLVHFFACMWLLAGTQAGKVGNQTVVGWVDRMHPAATNWEKYLTAFHAVNPKIASIGEGNLVARTNGEVVLSISLELVCGIYFGYLAGVMASIFGSKSQMEHIRDQKQQELREFLTAKNIPSELRNSIRDHFNHMYKKETGFDEQNLLAALPPALKHKLLMEIHEKEIKNVILFKNLGEEVTYQLCLKLKPFQASRGEQIMKQGDLAREMFMIAKGFVRIEKDGTSLGVLGSGGYFGEISIIEAAVQLGVGRAARASACATRSRSAWSVDRSDLCYLTREAVLQLMAEHEDLRLNLIKFQLKKQRIERKRTQRNLLAEVMSPAETDDNDSFGRTVTMTPESSNEDTRTLAGQPAQEEQQPVDPTTNLVSFETCSLERVRSAERKFMGGGETREETRPTQSAVAVPTSTAQTRTVAETKAAEGVLDGAAARPSALLNQARSPTVSTVAQGRKRATATLTSENDAKIVPIVSSSVPLMRMQSTGSINQDDIARMERGLMGNGELLSGLSGMSGQIADMKAEMAKQSTATEAALERQRTLTRDALALQSEETATMLRQIMRLLDEQRGGATADS